MTGPACQRRFAAVVDRALKDMQPPSHWNQAERHAFAAWQRNSVILPVLEAPLGTAARAVTACLLKANFDPDQPRVAAGSPEGGQWTDTFMTGGTSGAGFEGAPYTRASEAGFPPSFTTPVQESDLYTHTPTNERDPGAIPAQRRNGSVVRHPRTMKPVLMPRGVSLESNARQAEKIRLLPYKLRLARALLDIGPRRSMDYQYVHRNADNTYNRAYVNFGNYNFGVYMAAAGISLYDALYYTGQYNRLVGHPTDGSLGYGENARQSIFIPMGYRDYNDGKIVPR